MNLRNITCILLLVVFGSNAVQAGMFVSNLNGITLTGTDGITLTATDGITLTGTNNFISYKSNGITLTDADGVTLTGADGSPLKGADGAVSNLISPTGITLTGADGSPIVSVGLQSIDPELAVRLDQLTDDSNINAVIVFHQYPTDADLAQLQQIGILGGTRYRRLPFISVTTTRGKLIAVSHLSQRCVQSTAIEH